MAQPKKSKAQRLEEARRARERRRKRDRALVIAIPLLLLALLGAAFLANRDDGEVEGAVDTAACTPDTKFDSDAGSGRNHVPNPTYEVDPPAGGDHASVAAAPNHYPPGQDVRDGAVVHALEHGFVVFWYQPDLPKEQIDELLALHRDLRGSTLLVARESMDVPIAATAWHRRLLCEEPDITALRTFAVENRDKGPEKGFVRE